MRRERRNAVQVQVLLLIISISNNNTVRLRSLNVVKRSLTGRETQSYCADPMKQYLMIIRYKNYEEVSQQNLLISYEDIYYN